MALKRYQETFGSVQAGGDVFVLAGASVEVRDETSGALAAIFEDRAGNTAKANPFTTDSNGYGFFYAADGRYRVKATLSGETVDIRDVLLGSVQKDFDTVSEMDAFSDLSVGDIVRTLGYTTIGDGGGNDYEIVAAGTGTDDGGSFIDLSASGLQAKGLFHGLVNSAQFGTIGDSDGTPGIGTDNITNFNNFISYITTNGIKGYVGEGIYRLSSTLVISKNIRLEFYGWSLNAVSTESGGGKTGLLGKGAYLYFDHTGIGVDFYDASGTSRRIQGRIDNMATIRTQPTPGLGWVPNANDYDLYFGSDATSSPGDMYLSNPFLFNATKGLYCGRRSDPGAGATGRLYIDRISGQFFQVGIYIQRAVDVINIGETHFWTYWSLDPSVESYMLQNLKALRILRADKLNITHLFSIWHFAGVSLDSAAAGGETSNSTYIHRFSSDSSFRGLFIEGDDGLISIGHMRHGGKSSSGTTSHGEEAILVTGSNNQITVGSAEMLRAKNFMVRGAVGTDNHIALTNSLIADWAETGTTSSAILTGTGNIVDVSGKSKFGGITGTRRYQGTVNRLGAGRFVGGSNGTVAPGSTGYMGYSGFNTNTAATEIISGIKGTVYKFNAISSSGPGAGETFTYTVAKNGVDTGVTGQTTGSTLSLEVHDQVDVVETDRISLKLVTSAGATTTRHRFIITLDPD